jgi:hypothetical protein
MLAAGGCVEVELGEPELLVVEGFRDYAPMIEDPWGPRLDWIFPPALGRARLGTVHLKAEDACRAYLMGHPGRPRKTWRKAIEVRISFYGLDLLNLDIARADQILRDLEDGEMKLEAEQRLEGELKRIEAKGGQGALLPSSSGGTAIVILERHFEDCVEFGQVVEFESGSVVP